MDPKDHDKIFALTSHLTLNCIQSNKNCQDFQKNEKNIIKYSAGGLRDFLG